MNIEMIGYIVLRTQRWNGRRRWRDSVRLKLIMDRVRVEKISRALADKTRLMIFEAIARRNGMICGELVALRGVTPATVSHHLKILTEAGLVQCHRQGQFVQSRAVPQTIAEYSRALARLSRPTKTPRKRRRARPLNR
jgi:ArsR family transcriptional regulator, arsenate/arsenite/antimonite-responsive transcriptional repressor